MKVVRPVGSDHEAKRLALLWEFSIEDFPWVYQCAFVRTKTCLEKIHGQGTLL